MTETVFDRIAWMERYATRQEKVIIDFLRNNALKDLVLLSITEFSEKVGVGDATMLRFCRKLGLKGYSEFRFLLSQSSEEQEGPSESDADSILSHMITALRSTHDFLDEGELQKAADLILGAGRLYAMGSGNSGLAAQEFCNKVLRYGLRCEYWSDSHFQAIAASLLQTGDTILLFSVSGGTKDMLDIAKHASQQGVNLVVITNYPKSPLAKYANALLRAVARSAPLNSGSLVCKVSQLYIIDVLARQLRRQMGESAENCLRKTALSVMDKEV